MRFRHLRYKLLAVVGISVAVVMASLAYYWTVRQEHFILEQNARTVHRTLESVVAGVEGVMIPGYAHLAQLYAERLKKLPGLMDFRVIRTDGIEAFTDNSTIRAVNRRRGTEHFVARDTENPVRVLPPDSPLLREALEGRSANLAAFREERDGVPVMTFLDTISNGPACIGCHGGGQQARGMVMLSMSLLPVQEELARTRAQIALGAGIAILGVLLLTGYTMGVSVLRPIELVTSAMQRAASGNLGQRVPVMSRDEIGRMAESFNAMTEALKRSHEGLKLEQDKLTTIILSATEGIVVTNGEGEVVLVNPAAERLLGRSASQISRDGFLGLLGDPGHMRERLARGVMDDPQPLEHGGRILAVCAATIRAGGGEEIGSAALVRDVTEQKRLEDELRRQSVTDALTGLFNRRHLDAALEAEFARCQRYALPLAVLMQDVDHFKRFNDEHGHDMGDRVLREVAATMKRALRAQDVACRYGGEEFAAILPSTDAEGAVAVAERVRMAVEAMEIDGLKVTVSIGVASIASIDARDAQALVEAADAALYEAKHAGRNRVGHAGPRAAAA